MLIVCLRALILYIITFFIIRLMGKKELSKVQPFEIVIIVVIADLASSPMSDRGISLFDGIIPMITLLICYLIFSIVVKSSNKAEEIICGKNIIIIKDGKLVEKEIDKQKYTVSDIMTMLRDKDVFKIQDVRLAIIEPNGNFSIISKKSDIYDMPFNVIEDGEIKEANLELFDFKKEEVNNLLLKNNIKVEDIIVGTIDEKKEFLYQLKEGN